jgi:hypothetical protein
MEGTTTTRFQMMHEGQVYDVAYTICEPCLRAEVAALLATGSVERTYGTGSGAFTLSATPIAASGSQAVPTNGVAHVEGHP